MLSDRIRQARKSLDVSTRQLAARLDVPRETLTAYEDGTLEPDLEALRRLAGECGLPIWWFLLPNDPAERKACQTVMAAEEQILARMAEALGHLRRHLRSDMSVTEWPSWEELSPEELYGAILAGRLRPLEHYDLRKAEQYLRADLSEQGVSDAVLYLYSIWARPRHPSAESEADYVRRVTERIRVA